MSPPNPHPLRGRAGLQRLLEAAGAPDPASAALLYARLGLSVLPLAGKRPALSSWKAYQSTAPDLDTLRRWIAAGRFGGVGLVCGPVSGGLVVVDLDGQAAYVAFCARFPQLGDSYTVATGSGRGWHVYLVSDCLPRSMRAARVELRSSGLLVAAPPGPHPDTGRRYRVLYPLPVRAVPDLDALRDWIASLGHERPLRQERPPHPSRPGDHRPGPPLPPAPLNPDLVAAVAAHLRDMGYRSNGPWLNGPCPYPERHAHRDDRPSFGFHTSSGYGWCFVCGSIRLKELAPRLGLKPLAYGGLVARSLRSLDSR